MTFTIPSFSLGAIGGSVPGSTTAPTLQALTISVTTFIVGK